METSGVVIIKELEYWKSAALDGSTIPSPPSLIGKLNNSLSKSLHCGCSMRTGRKVAIRKSGKFSLSSTQ